MEIKNVVQQRVYFIAFFQPTYENPRGFSIQYLFANFTLNQRNKAYTNTLATTMKKILLILIIGISNLTFAQIGTKLSGKIVNEKLTCLFGVKITNLNSGTESLSDQNGRYEIIATENDTLEFQIIGFTTDKIKIEKPTQTRNLIMMDKDVNCLGAIWTEKQYRKANKRIERQLKKLYKKAEKEKVWKNSSC